MLLFSASLKKQKTFRRPGFLQWFQFFEMCLRPTENVMKAIFSEDDLSDEFFLRKCKNRLNNQAHTT